MQASSISDELLAILVCPESKQPLSLASEEVISSLNSLVNSGQLKNKSGKPVTNIITAALVREDSKVVYPIIDGIPIMLIEEGILI